MFVKTFKLLTAPNISKYYITKPIFDNITVPSFNKNKLSQGNGPGMMTLLGSKDQMVMHLLMKCNLFNHYGTITLVDYNSILLSVNSNETSVYFDRITLSVRLVLIISILGQYIFIHHIN